ncbi:hypothetical protein [Leptothrix discophora]|uniref:Uncharacterized protein n=1 Tax=Leptothrix discophora TaxID=89 RepID=A0ABT9G668_LEPDI|nr:hypothetical protein [Leptothrix discophora]MDP4301978.1 hypothetical protein [Leptothrix discophora]
MANANPQRPNKFVTFNQADFDLLTLTAQNTGLTFSVIVGQLVGAHRQELSELNRWLTGKEGDQRTQAIHAVEQYGPNDLITELQRIDPTYQPPAALQMTAGAHILRADEVAGLRRLLANQDAAQ